MKRYYEAVYLIQQSDNPLAIPIEHTMAFEAQNKEYAREHAEHCMRAACADDPLSEATLDRVTYLGLKKPDYELGVLR